MNKVIKDDFLLESSFAIEIFNKISSLPIVDYHCHIEAKEIYDNRTFSTITEAWLGGDHYKWRAMRCMGIHERLITGDAPDFDKFFAYASIMPYMPGHPLYHFSHLELERYFGIGEPLTAESARRIYDKANEVLAGLPARKIIELSNVDTIVTTNDPLDDLSYHRLLAADASFKTKVLPAFRPDKAVNIENAAFPDYISKLSKVCGHAIVSLIDIKQALRKRLEFFIANGCRASDHGITTVPYVKNYEIYAEEAVLKALRGLSLSALEADSYKTSILLYLAELYAQNGIVMELHFGCSRNTNSKMFDILGPDTGFDIIRGTTGADQLYQLLDEMNKNSRLPKTLLYSLNPNDDALLACVMGSFQRAGVKGYVQQGSAWWFNDNQPGIEKQLAVYATQAPLDTFIGMLTDSRSFLSYPRHEYFRRILANYLGNLVAKGAYPAQSLDYLAKTAQNISYYNVKEFIFGSKASEEEKS